ncbi:hypothetical protein Tco_1231315 [Tanacetum coccineum]
MLWERLGIANMDFIQLGGGGVSRVDEMILARERSGFAGKKVWDDIPVIPSPPLPLPSPPLPLPAQSSPLLLPATDRREDVSEADIPLRKRLCLTAPTLRFEVGESSAAAARRPGLDVTHATDYGFIDTVVATPGCPMTREVGYGIIDVYDDMVGDMEETAPTTLEAVNQRVADLATTLA